MKNLKKEFFYLKPLGIAFAISLICYFIFNYINIMVAYFFATIAGMTGIPFIIKFLVFLVQYLGILLGKGVASSERRIKQLDKSDFKLDKEYYREILKNNSPLILGYIDNLELDKNKIISEILYLEMRNLISIENGKINKLINQDETYLSESEKMIVDAIDGNSIKFNNNDTFIKELKAQVTLEAESLSLVLEKKNKIKIDAKFEKIKKNFLKTMILIPFLIILIPIIMLIHEIELSIFGYSVETIEVFYGWIIFGIIAVIGLGAVLSLLMSGYKQGKSRIYKRTQKGQEINQKLEGLKNYLKDYSLMDEREAKELELWDEYLIYSVMFGQNKKIIEEYEKYIEIEK